MIFSRVRVSSRPIRPHPAFAMIDLAAALYARASSTNLCERAPSTRACAAVEPNADARWACGETRTITWRYSGSLAGTSGRATLRLYQDGVNQGDAIAVPRSTRATLRDRYEFVVEAHVPYEPRPLDRCSSTRASPRTTGPSRSRSRPARSTRCGVRARATSGGGEGSLGAGAAFGGLGAGVPSRRASQSQFF